MKITTKVVRNIDLELTQEQIEAFDIVNEVLTDLHGELFEQTDHIQNDDSGDFITTQEIADAVEILSNLVTASGFSYLEEG